MKLLYLRKCRLSQNHILVKNILKNKLLHSCDCRFPAETPSEKKMQFAEVKQNMDRIHFVRATELNTDIRG